MRWHGAAWMWDVLLERAGDTEVPGSCHGHVSLCRRGAHLQLSLSQLIWGGLI